MATDIKRERTLTMFHDLPVNVDLSHGSLYRPPSMSLGLQNTWSIVYPVTPLPLHVTERGKNKSDSRMWTGITASLFYYSVQPAL